MSYPLCIKKVRELGSNTQELMATQLGMTQAGYSKLDSGTTDISLSKLEQIAKFLEVSLEDLVSFASQKCFLSFNNVRDNNNGSVVIEINAEIIKTLYEGKIAILKRLLTIAESRLSTFTEKCGVCYKHQI